MNRTTAVKKDKMRIRAFPVSDLTKYIDQGIGLT